MSIRPATKEEIDAIFENARDEVYSDAELFDFTHDDDQADEIMYDIPDTLSDFIAEFEEDDYKAAIMMYVDGSSVEEIVEYYEAK